MQPRRVDQQPAAQRHRIGASDIDLDAAPCYAAAQHGTEEHRYRAGMLGVALQCQHEGVAVDDAGGRRQKRTAADQTRLQGDCLLGGQHPHALDAVALGTLLDPGEQRIFLRVGCHDQLAAVDVWHAFLGAVRVQLPAPGDAGARHQAVGLVVDAGVDHLAVARGRLGADTLRRVQDDDLTSRHRQRTRHREADDPGAGHDAIDFLHACFLLPVMESTDDRWKARLGRERTGVHTC